MQLISCSGLKKNINISKLDKFESICLLIGHFYGWEKVYKSSITMYIKHVSTMILSGDKRVIELINLFSERI